MRKTAIVLILLQLLVFGAVAAESAKECSLCFGAVSDLTVVPPAPVPLLVQIGDEGFATAATAIDALSPEQRRKLTVIVTYDVDRKQDPLLEVEQETKTIVEWARLHGPFDGLGVHVANADATLIAYAVKRLSVTAQGLDVASQIVVPDFAAARGAGSPLTTTKALFEGGAQPYFDAVVVDAADVATAFAWVAEHDPSKKIHAVAQLESPNALFDLAKTFTKGAVRAYATGPILTPAVAAGSNAVPAATQFLAALAQANRAFTGDWAHDSTSRTTMLDAKGVTADMPLLTFVRGEDLRTIVIPRGDASAPSIVALESGDQYAKPRRVDAAGEQDITDSGRRGTRLLVGTQPAKQPYLIAVEHTDRPHTNVAKESISVATQRGITVEEIIRNHQSYDAFQESIQPRFIARNTTKLRFEIGAAAESLEATIAGDYFSDPNGRADWVWQDFLINGVRWKYGAIPELPLIQPEKVTQLPLDIHLTNEYRYQLVRETEVLGYRVYEVRFEPPPNAPEGLPLYRGTVFIDRKSWARVRIAMVQLHLTGEILSNEERVDFVPFLRETKTPLSPAQVAGTDPRAIVWMPHMVQAQQVVSAAGRATVVQRNTTFENFRIDPPEFETLLAQVSASDARMIRETEAGLRYLERRADGQRVVKEGFDTSRLFALGGIHHDEGIDYPVVPLGGINYFNFNLWGRGIQTNVFFAGVIIAANATHPNVANTRTNVGVDFFGIGVPVENTIFRGGSERPDEGVKNIPLGLTLRAGHPVFEFGKIDVSLGVNHFTYQEGEETADDFVIPSDTFMISPAISAQYARKGYTFAANYDYSRRTTWEPWGRLDEYDPEQQSFARFGASFGKSFYLPKFQRLGFDVNYLDGMRLDRFSKYELGFFGAQRVHGIRSGSVRAEKAIIAHASYGFVFSDQIRLEAFYDHALVDDEVAGYRREPFQGVGIGGQMVGPYGTLVRLDIGKSIGRNAQDGFVANVVFLKLF